MINHLRLEHFKAFRDPAEMTLDGKNVLVYGENGAGKSSLYQALKIIFHRKRIFDAQIAPTVTDPLDRRNAEKDVLGQYNYQLTPLTDFTLAIDGIDFAAYMPTGIDVCMISRDDILAEDIIVGIRLLNTSRPLRLHKHVVMQVTLVHTPHVYQTNGQKRYAQPSYSLSVSSCGLLFIRC